MENQIVLRAYNTKRQTPVKLSPLEDKSGKLFTGQGKFGYFDLLTEEEKRNLPVIINHETLVTVENGTVVDMNDPIDQANWLWMQKHPYIAIDEEVGRSSRDAVLYVDNPERKAEIHLTKDKRITMAKAKIYGASHGKKVQLAEALGNLGAKALSTNLLEEWLVFEAAKTPDSITKLLDAKQAKTLSAMALYEELKKYKMVTRYAGTWRFQGQDGVPLGNNIDEVVDYINDNANKEQVFLMSEQLKEKKGE